MIGAKGRRVLIIEDEMMIALMVEQMLSDLGHHVVGIATTAADAVAKIEADPQAIDVATLDINLGGVRSHEVAELLGARSIPFIIMTGYHWEEFPEFNRRVVVHKPFLVEHIERALLALEVPEGNRVKQEPFPLCG